MDELDERNEDRRFAIEANDLLREVWNRGLFDGQPILKKRLGELLDVKDGQTA